MARENQRKRAIGEISRNERANIGQMAGMYMQRRVIDIVMRSLGKAGFSLDFLADGREFYYSFDINGS